MGRRFSRRALANALEREVQIRLEQIIFIRWIRCDRDSTEISTGAEIVVIPPTVGVGQSEIHSGGQIIRRLSHNPVHILLSIENIIVDQIRIERVLLGVLIPKIDLPIAFLLQLPDTEPSLIRVALATLAWLTCGSGAIVAVKIGREVAEYPHR